MFFGVEKKELGNKKVAVSWKNNTTTRRQKKATLQNKETQEVDEAMTFQLESVYSEDRELSEVTSLFL